jgi:hypothetical protein
VTLNCSLLNLMHNFHLRLVRGNSHDLYNLLNIDNKWSKESLAILCIIENKFKSC